ncbi:MAG: hypothetical protein WCT04_04445 [Planctomycetota bacterium]
MNKKLTDFLQRLKDAKIFHSFDRYRDDAISVRIVVPGQRWEVDFLDDGSVDVERFISNGELHGDEVFAELFNTFSEPAVASKSLNKSGKSFIKKKQKRSLASETSTRQTVNR